jgi:hypothetical protein
MNQSKTNELLTSGFGNGIVIHQLPFCIIAPTFASYCSLFCKNCHPPRTGTQQLGANAPFNRIHVDCMCFFFAAFGDTI